MAATLVPLALVGCGGPALNSSLAARSVAPEEAMILPPPGGPSMTGVVERRAANAVRQDVFLRTASALPGENYLRISLYGATVREQAENAQSTFSPVTEAGIGRELREEFPGLAMTRSPYFAQNGYGPFGYAVGRKGQDLCLYGWQQIRAPEGVRSFWHDAGAIQVRLRACETGASEEALLRTMYGFTISGFVASRTWNPYGTPAAPPSTLGRPGQPVYPDATPGRTNVPANVARVLPEQPAPAAAPPVAAARPAAAAAPATAPAAAPPRERNEQGPTVVVPPPQPAAADNAAGQGRQVLVPPPPVCPENAGFECR